MRICNELRYPLSKLSTYFTKKHFGQVSKRFQKYFRADNIAHTDGRKAGRFDAGNDNTPSALGTKGKKPNQGVGDVSEGDW